MDELLVFRHERLVRRLPLGAGPVLVGRGAEVDLALEGGGVSRKHVWIRPSREGWRFEDAGSTNGVQVAGRSLAQGRMREGEALEVGEFRLYLLGSGRTASSGAAGPVEELFLATARIGTSHDHESLLEAMLDAAVRIFQAERGMILLPDDEGIFRPELARGMDLGGDEAAASQTVARQAASTGKPIVLANSHVDGDVLDAASIEASAARSILCAPVVDGDQVRGVVYLDGDASERLFGDRDLTLLSTFAVHVASALAALERRRQAQAETDRLRQLSRRAAQDDGRDPGGLVAVSEPMQVVRRQLEAVAIRDTTVLVLGESGTGKELVARAIHECSPRSKGPFVPVNCMALVAGLAASELFGHAKGAFTGADQARAGRFELADGGTLFLDEVGELSLEMQIRLLRVLQERCFERVGDHKLRRVDVRVVAATNRDMPQAIADGRFREDLWYRLNVFTLELPRLADRPADIPALVEHFVLHFRRAFGRSLAGPDAATMACLVGYGWPGNIRELRNVIERAFVLETGDRISTASLPLEVAGAAATPAQAHREATGSTDFHTAKDAFEETFFRRCLRAHGGNMTAAAAEAGVPRKTIYRKLKALKLTVEQVLAD